MSCFNIRGCRIGEGRPKVILPIVERTEAAILEKAAQFSTLLADCVEWRADWFEGFQSPAAIARCVQKLRVALRDKLLLVTFRTKAIIRKVKFFFISGDQLYTLKKRSVKIELM